MNALKKLTSLLTAQTDDDTERSTVAQVLINQGDGTSVVKDDAGKEFVVRGNAVATGKYVLIMGGQIQQEVPALPFSSFYVYPDICKILTVLVVGTSKLSRNRINEY